ncbi:MAG: hypothetical protein GXP47_05460 [Acidobacteria bacterium]|nr:hypothetical protein [Acidobacteriota bacterium]
MRLLGEGGGKLDGMNRLAARLDEIAAALTRKELEEARKKMDPEGSMSEDDPRKTVATLGLPIELSNGELLEPRSWRDVPVSSAGWPLPGDGRP